MMMPMAVRVAMSALSLLIVIFVALPGAISLCCNSRVTRREKLFVVLLMTLTLTGQVWMWSLLFDDLLK